MPQFVLEHSGNPMSNHYNMPHLPSSSSPLVTIKVDGKDVQVPGDTNLLEALQAVGIETPHICYHPYLPVSGNCRQCLVEVEGPRGMGLVISCYTPVKAGMVVATPASSQRVKSTRKAVSEFMLVNHPLDCPICDKAGECTLQKNYMEAGQNESRLRGEVGKHYHGNPDNEFVDSKGQTRGGKRVDLGPRVLLDEERCVQCDRCVRFMRHVAGDEQLQLAARSDHTYITTFPGEKLDHEYDLCVTDICPTGALTGKYFRFQQRVWMLSRTPSVSMDDSLGANIWIDHNEGHVWRLMPRCNPEVNRSWLSNTSRLAFEKFAENRLPASDIESVKLALQTQGKVALVAGGECTLEDIVALKMLKASLGDRAEIFVGSFRPVVAADGIAKSGDPVANRAGFKLLGLAADNLADLVKRASEFNTLMTINNDLWGDDANQAKALEGIENRIALAAFNTETAHKANVVFGVNHWSEVTGTMVNCNGILQKLSAAPTAPDAELIPTFQALSTFAGTPITEALEAFKVASKEVPVLSGLSYETIRSTGAKLDGVQA